MARRSGSKVLSKLKKRDVKWTRYGGVVSNKLVAGGVADLIFSLKGTAHEIVSICRILQCLSYLTKFFAKGLIPAPDIFYRERWTGQRMSDVARILFHKRRFTICRCQFFNSTVFEL